MLFRIFISIMFLCSPLTGISKEDRSNTTKTPKASKPKSQKKVNGRHRIVEHDKAYKKRRIGEYINFKITPPEKRGKEGYIAIEIYNYSKKHISLMNFYIYLETNDFLQIEGNLTVEDMPPNWGDIRWVKTPLRKGKLPGIVKVRVEKMKAYNKQGKLLKIRYNTDLIKK